MENEIWKAIKGYEGLYEVSDLGRIKSLSKPHGHYTSKEIIKKQRLDSKGRYLLIDLTKDKKKQTLLVHRIVGKHFISNPLNLPEINHKKGITTLNHATELEWCNGSGNAIHSYRILNRESAMTNKRGVLNRKARLIGQYDKKTGSFINSFFGSMEIQRQLGYDQSSIHKCCKGTIPSFRGCVWKYV